MRTTLDINDELLRAVRAHATGERKTLKATVEQALREFLAGPARGVVLAGDPVAVPLELSPARVAVEVRPDRVTHLTFDLVVHDLRDHPGKTWGVLLDEVRVADVAVTVPE